MYVARFSIQMLLLKYNDNYDLYDEQERAEFIFRIFQHVVLGGDPKQVGGEVHCGSFIIFSLKFVASIVFISYI